jgi:hypothetical protein
MNYLDLVNNVLRRLREGTVSSINENVLSALVGDLVNDAKRQVEDSWDWSALRTTITVPTVSGTAQYALTGSQNRATLISAINSTSQGFLIQKDQNWGRRENLSTGGNGSPCYFVTNEPNNAGDTQVTLYPTPDGIYMVDFAVVLRTPDMTAEGDTTALPAQTIIQLAYALALRESGEAGGNSSPEQFGVAMRVLSDTIAQDSSLNPTDLIWYTV